MGLWTRPATKPTIKVHTGQHKLNSLVHVDLIQLALHRNVLLYAFKTLTGCKKHQQMQLNIIFEYKRIQTSSANVATAQKENRVSISPVNEKSERSLSHIYRYF